MSKKKGVKHTVSEATGKPWGGDAESEASSVIHGKKKELIETGSKNKKHIEKEGGPNNSKKKPEIWTSSKKKKKEIDKFQKFKSSRRPFGKKKRVERSRGKNGGEGKKKKKKYVLPVSSRFAPSRRK